MYCAHQAGSRRFSFISLWDSFDAIRRFAGETIESPLFHPGRPRLSSSSSSLRRPLRVLAGSLASTQDEREVGRRCAASATAWWTRCSSTCGRCGSARCGVRCPRVRKRLSAARPPAGRRTPPIVYEEFKRDVPPTRPATSSPVLGWVIGTGTPFAMCRHVRLRNESAGRRFDRRGRRSVSRIR